MLQQSGTSLNTVKLSDLRTEMRDLLLRGGDGDVPGRWI